MIQRKLKKCKRCGKPKYIWARGMCKDCDRSVNPGKHGANSLDRNTGFGKRSSSLKPISDKRRAEKEENPGRKLALFEKLWEERHHECYITGEPLLPRYFKNKKENPLWFNQFAHILPHGQYKEWEFEEHNIILVRPEVHDQQETYEEFRALYEQKKIEYNRLKREGKL